MIWFKRLLMFLGSVFLVLLLGLAAFYAWNVGLDKSSRAFAEQTALAMFENWDYQVLKSRADPMMFASTTEEGFKNAFARISRLGKFKSMPDGCQGASAINIGGNVNQPSVTARYNCRAEFENDTALIVLMLVRGEDAVWRVGGLHVESDYLVNLKD